MRFQQRTWQQIFPAKLLAYPLLTRRNIDKEYRRVSPTTYLRRYSICAIVVGEGEASLDKLVTNFMRDGGIAHY